MGYENAPATRMLATHCAVCARPLVDATSVETGIGPDCRQKHGYNVDVDPEDRADANVIVHRIALDRSAATVAEGCRDLRALGFEKLASVIESRVAAVTVTEVGPALIAVDTPFDEAVVDAMRSIPGRRWDKERKVNTFPVSSRNIVWAVLRRFFDGQLGVGPRGAFLITSKAA
jgi:Family of unknown function (DUF6011)